MKSFIFPAVAALITALTLWFAPTQPQMVHSKVRSDAAQAQMFDTFHDAPTGFVYVKLPQGWRFVGEAADGDLIEVFHDLPSDFVYVRTASGWHFAGVAADSTMMALR